MLLCQGRLTDALFRCLWVDDNAVADMKKHIDNGVIPISDLGQFGIAMVPRVGQSQRTDTIALSKYRHNFLSIMVLLQGRTCTICCSSNILQTTRSSFKQQNHVNRQRVFKVPHGQKEGRPQIAPGTRNRRKLSLLCVAGRYLENHTIIVVAMCPFLWQGSTSKTTVFPVWQGGTYKTTSLENTLVPLRTHANV